MHRPRAATIRILKRERLVDRAVLLGSHLRAGLEALRERHPDAVADVRGHGLCSPSSSSPAAAPVPAAPPRATRQAAQHVAPAPRSGRGKSSPPPAAARIHLLPTGDRTGILFTPPFTVTSAQIDRLVDFLDRAIKRV